MLGAIGNRGISATIWVPCDDPVALAEADPEQVLLAASLSELEQVLLERNPAPAGLSRVVQNERQQAVYVYDEPAADRSTIGAHWQAILDYVREHGSVRIAGGCTDLPQLPPGFYSDYNRLHYNPLLLAQRAAAEKRAAQRAAQRLRVRDIWQALTALLEEVERATTYPLLECLPSGIVTRQAHSQLFLRALALHQKVFGKSKYRRCTQYRTLLARYRADRQQVSVLYRDCPQLLELWERDASAGRRRKSP